MESRHSWFQGSGLGLFVHFGPYAKAGWDASWHLVGGVMTLPHVHDVPVADYHANAAGFAPDPQAPKHWIAAAAKAGARYAIMTTKHHDGFCMWPTATKDYRLEGVDMVRAFVEACRAHGLKVGLYFSLPDWSDPDYPAFREEDKPYVFGRYPAASEAGWARFMERMKAQLHELLTGYGPIDILWFDGSWERAPELWQVDELDAMIRTLQPDILINDRLPERGDYATPEQFIPPEPPEGLWETCLTMNESWGNNTADTDYKSPTRLIHTLCEVAGRGGNLLLNIGPDGVGGIVPEQAARLEALAAWTQVHGEAIFGTQAGLRPWQFYGPTTRRERTIYAFVLMRPVEPVALRGLPVKHVTGVEVLGHGPVDWEPRVAVIDQLLNRDPLGELLVSVPGAALDPHATVIRLSFDQEV